MGSAGPPGPRETGLGGAEQALLLLLLLSHEAVVSPQPDNNPDQSNSFY